MNLFWNRKEHANFVESLSHKHVFDSECAYMPVGSNHDAVMLRCRCGEGKWFFTR